MSKPNDYSALVFRLGCGSPRPATLFLATPAALTLYADHLVGAARPVHYLPATMLGLVMRLSPGHGSGLWSSRRREPGCPPVVCIASRPWWPCQLRRFKPPRCHRFRVAIPNESGDSRSNPQSPGFHRLHRQPPSASRWPNSPTATATEYYRKQNDQKNIQALSLYPSRRGTPLRSLPGGDASPMISEWCRVAR